MIELTINYVTRVVCSVAIFEVRDKADQTEKLFLKAKKAGDLKRLDEAIKHSDKLLKLWSYEPNFWEKLFQSWFLKVNLFDAEKYLRQWQENLHQAKQLIKKGKIALKKVSQNPRETRDLILGIEYLKKSQTLLSDSSISRKIQSAKIELEKRQTWEKFVRNAYCQEKAKYFKKALASYCESQNLYPSKKVQSKIIWCQKYLGVEQEYVKRMQAAQHLCRAGNFHKAYKLLRNTLDKFSREDGKQFHQEVLKIIKSKKAFLSGLHAEKGQDFDQAIHFYADACDYLNEISEDSSDDEYRLRQAIVAYKQSRWQLAEDLLRGLTDDRPRYLRGLIFIQQSKYDAAKSAWTNVKIESLPQQLSKLHALSESAYLEALQKIENHVDAGTLSLAVEVSQETIKNFPKKSLVEKNLSGHILPRLEVETWQKTDINWYSLSDELQANFLKDPTIKSLHNLAVAMYYCVINEPKPDYDLLYKFNANWSMAIANLPNDSSLENLLWREDQSVDHHQLKEKLEVLWDNALEKVKEQDLNLYLEIRDWQRLDRYALQKLEFPVKKGFRLKNLWVSPSAKELLINSNYSISQDYFDSQSLIPQLYTCFGQSLVAFLEGDAESGLLLKSHIPKKTFKDAEIQANITVTYFEVCHLLKQKDWHLAFIQLSPISAAIRSNSEWLKNIDTLCEKIICDLKDSTKINFVSQWSELLDSQAGRHHLIEIKIDEIRHDMAEDKLSLRNGLSKLKDLKTIDARNPILLELIDRIESILKKQEVAEQIDRYFKQGDLDGVVSYALRHGDMEIRQTVAEILIDIFKQNQYRLTSYDVEKIKNWVRQLCPDIV